MAVVVNDQSQAIAALLVLLPSKCGLGVPRNSLVNHVGGRGCNKAAAVASS